MFGLVGLGIVVFASAGFVFHMAEQRGHNGVLWAILSVLFTVLAMIVTSIIVVGSDTSWSGPALFVKVIALVVVPMVVPLGLVSLSARIPAGSATTHKSAWSLSLLGERDSSGACVLRLLNDGLVIEREHAQRQVLSFEQIHEVAGDGECLRVMWTEDVDERPLLFIPPSDKYRTREIRVRFVNAIAERINARR